MIFDQIEIKIFIQDLYIQDFQVNPNFRLNREFCQDEVSKILRPEFCNQTTVMKK